MDGQVVAAKPAVCVLDVYEKLAEQDRLHGSGAASWGRAAIRLYLALMATTIIIAVVVRIWPAVDGPRLYAASVWMLYASLACCGFALLTILYRIAPGIFSPFRALVSSIDKQLGYERGIIDSLAVCDKEALKEAGARVDAELKIANRRFTVVGLLTAVLSFLLTSLSRMDATNVPAWLGLPTISLFVSAIVMGLMVATSIMASLAGHLERMSFIFSRAAGKDGEAIN